jgi:hypothetical protein
MRSALYLVLQFPQFGPRAMLDSIWLDFQQKCRGVARAKALAKPVASIGVRDNQKASKSITKPLQGSRFICVLKLNIPMSAAWEQQWF